MCIVTYSRINKYSALKKLNKFNKIKDLKTPLWGHIEVAGSCSHKCPWCYGEYHNVTKEYMSIDNFKIILNKMKEIGIIQITLSGGEPLEHPQFEEIINIVGSHDFIFHLNTNGEFLTNELLHHLINNGLKQVSFNFQGSKWHDKLHGVESYENLKKTIIDTNLSGVETVATVVIGGYNINDLSEIYREAKQLGVDRLRAIDVTNSPKYLQSINLKDLFAVSGNLAKSLGYNHTISYEPLVEGDIHIKCIAGSGLYTHVKVNGKMIWCPCLDNENEIADWITDSTEELVFKYRENNKKDSCSDCLARK